MGYSANLTTATFDGVALGEYVQDVSVSMEGVDIDVTTLADTVQKSADGIPAESVTLKIIGSVVGKDRGDVGTLVVVWPDGPTTETLTAMRMSKRTTSGSVNGALATDCEFVVDESRA